MTDPLDTNYNAHLNAITQSALLAIMEVRGRVPDLADQLYIHTMEADGQFWDVTVGVANGYDYVVTVETYEDDGRAEVREVERRV